MLSLHFGLFLVPSQLIVFIPLKMVIDSLLNHLFDPLLDPTWISNCFFAKDFHIVAEFDFGLGRGDQAQFNSFLLVLFFVEAFHATEFLLFFVC